MHLTSLGENIRKLSYNVLMKSDKLSASESRVQVVGSSKKLWDIIFSSGCNLLRSVGAFKNNLEPLESNLRNWECPRVEFEQSITVGLDFHSLSTSLTRFQKLGMVKGYNGYVIYNKSILYPWLNIILILPNERSEYNRRMCVSNFLLLCCG